MAELATSVFDKLSGLTVEEMLSNPEYLPDLLLESKEGDEVHKTFFREKNVKSNVVAYREVKPDYLEDEPEDVPEFGEIPVSDPHIEEYKSANIARRGIGLRVSWDQIDDNDVDAVAQEMLARRNTIIRDKARDAVAALRSADIQEMAVDVAWNQQGAKPASDYEDAEELILDAEDEDGNSFGWVPDTLWIHPRSVKPLLRDEDIQKYYVGNMASENPIFSSSLMLPKVFGQVTVATSFFIPKDEAWLGVQGQAGVLAQREPEWMSEFYQERGSSGRGGANLSYRSDYLHRRRFVVTAPTSLVRLTGIMA